MSRTNGNHSEPQYLTDNEAAFARFVPRQFWQLLGRRSIVDVELGDHVEKEMTLLFSDIRDFTSLSEAILPTENFRFINSYLSVMEPAVSQHHGFIDKYIGDGIMALYPGSADDGLRSGIDMLRRLVVYNEGRARAGFVQVRIGIGVNTGLVMLGTVGGHKRMDSTVIGEAVNLASRLEAMTKNYGTPLIISEHSLHALEAPSSYCIRFLDRFQHKGGAQSQSVYEVFDADPEPLRLAKQETLAAYEEATACYHLGHPALALPLLQECLRLAPDDRVARIYLERCGERLRAEEKTGNGHRVEEIVWRDEYSVGIAEIDRQHRELLALIAVVSDRIEAGGEALKTSLDGLAELLRQHTESEENLMRRYGYPFALQHLRGHDRFGRNFAELRGKLEHADGSTLLLKFRVRLQLADWQVNHIARGDFHLGHFLQRAGLE